MSIAVNPVSNYYSNYIPPNNTSATNAAKAYEQLLAIQAEDALFSASDTSAFANDNNTALNDASLGSADLLNLSPAALNILNGIDSLNGGNTLSAIDNSNSIAAENSTTLTLTGTSGISVLTPNQQAQVAGVVAEFANQPLNAATVSQIQSALTAEGINPEQFSIQQLFNAYAYSYAPTLSFNGQLFTETLASELDNV